MPEVAPFAAALRHGFVVAETHYRWSTLLEEVLAEHTADPSWTQRDINFPCKQLGDLPVLGASVRAPHPTRPVTAVDYGLAASLALQTEVGWRRLAKRLDGALGPGQHQQHEALPGFPASGRVAATSTWQLAEVEVVLSAFATVRQEQVGATSGRLWLRHDEDALAAPFVAAFRAAAEAWVRSPGKVQAAPVARMVLAKDMDEAATERCW
jgi:hypothetical protein